MSWQYFMFDYLRKWSSHKVLHSMNSKLQSCFIRCTVFFWAGRYSRSARPLRPWLIIILVSRPLKWYLPMWAGSYYLLCYYVLFCTKPTYLTARAWPFSVDFNDNNFGCGTKKCMQVGDGKLLYYKSWPKSGKIYLTRWPFFVLHKLKQTWTLFKHQK